MKIAHVKKMSQSGYKRNVRNNKQLSFHFRLISNQCRPICTFHLPVFGDGARMARTPNFRKVESLLLGTDILGEHDSRVIAVVHIPRSAGTPLNVEVVVTGEMFADGTGRLMYGAGLLIRSRSSTRKLEWVGKVDGKD